VLRNALLRAGATIEDGETEPGSDLHLRKADLYSMGLSGGNNSREKRKQIAKQLGLPERISADGLLEALNTLLSSDRIGMDFFDAYCCDDPNKQDT
jgi:ribonuclease M5